MEESSVAGTTDLLRSYQTGGGALSETRRKTQDNLGRVMASYHGAKSMTRVAVNYLKEEGDKDRFYKTYFGGNAIGDVIRNFEAIAYDNSPGRNLKCNDHCGSSSHPNSHRDGISTCRQNECCSWEAPPRIGRRRAAELLMLSGHHFHHLLIVRRSIRISGSLQRK